MARQTFELAGTLSLQIMNLVGRRIIGGEFKVGQTLPTEPALCDQLGVSRTTVREAIRKLQGKGLLRTAPKIGTTVQPTDHWNQLDSDILRWRVESGPDDAVLLQLYELRAALEPEACKLAASHGHAADHAAIVEAMDRIDASLGDPDATIVADVEFHMAIVAATRNMFFISMTSAIRTALEVTFKLSAKRRGFPRAELALHRQLRDALVARQGDAAAAIMKDLLAASRRSAKLREAPTELKSIPTRRAFAARRRGRSAAF